MNKEKINYRLVVITVLAAILIAMFLISKLRKDEGNGKYYHRIGIYYAEQDDSEDKGGAGTSFVARTETPVHGILGHNRTIGGHRA